MSDAMRATSRRRGLAWCAISIVLVTLAQLALGWAVPRMPPLSLESVPQLLVLPVPLSLALLLSGLLGYALSMLCWFFTLRRLPLSYAYPMLSISYALVYLLAAVLPWFGEPVTTLKTAGVFLIMFGVLLIHSTDK